MGKVSRSLAALAGLFLAAAPWVPAAACSMIDEYVRPTNFELIQISDSIVVATARAERREEDWTKVAFDVVEKVKGEAPPRLELAGRLGKIRPSDLSVLAEPHPEAMDGMCSRITFRKGGRYLLFLQKDEKGQLRGTGEAFSRINEDYAGEQTVWMRTVRRYLRIQSMAEPMEQLSILAGLAERGRGLAGERLAPVEIADVRDHLSSLSPHKPTAYLLAAYEALEQGKTPDYGVRPRSADRERSEADALARFVFDGLPEEGSGPEAQRGQVLTALVNGRHPEAMPLFDRLAAEIPEDPDRIGLVLRYFARNGAYGRAFEWIETRLIERLRQLDPAAAGRLLVHVANMQSGGREGEEPWRSDARAAALWPELALSLYWYQVDRFGAGDAVRFDSAIRTLPRGEYRTRPALTRALAVSYEPGVAEWAVTELRDERKRQAFEALPPEAASAAEDPARLPLQTLLGAWQTKHEALLEQVFCQSGPRRLLLMREIGESAAGNYQSLIENIAVSALSTDEREALRTAMQRWQERMHRPDDLFGPNVAELLAGGRGKGKPIVCRSP